ncbi:MAG: hypothetical protein ACOYNI_12165 [Acidimicrobiia bacterium]
MTIVEHSLEFDESPLGPVRVAAPNPGPLRIADIQGARHISPYEGEDVVRVPGVVTATTKNGFYLQDPDGSHIRGASSALFVYSGSRPEVAVGDGVEVSGRVVEYRFGGTHGFDNLTTTQIVAPVVRAVSCRNPLPAPIVLGMSTARPPTGAFHDGPNGSVEEQATDPHRGHGFYESMEGMRVRVPMPRVVGPGERGHFVVMPGDVGMMTGNGGVKLRAGDANPARLAVRMLDRSGRDLPAADVGDVVETLEGVLDYAFAMYQIGLTDEPTLIPQRHAPDVLAPAAPEEMTITGWNLNKLSKGTARGEDFDALAEKFELMGWPDLCFLQELGRDLARRDEHSDVSSQHTLHAIRDAIRRRGGPRYKFRLVDPEPHADGGDPTCDIRNAYMFRVDRGLEFVDRGTPTATRAVKVRVRNGELHVSPSPGRIDPNSIVFHGQRKPLVGEFRLRGHPLIAINLHLLSKIGDQPLAGRFQPPKERTAARREEMASVVKRFVEQLIEADPNVNIVVEGDVNDHEWSSTIAILESAGLELLTRSLPEHDRYTYIHDGNSQHLDHLLVRGPLFTGPALTTGVMHHSVDFASSREDHDAVFVRVPVVATDGYAQPLQMVLGANGRLLESAGLPASERHRIESDQAKILTLLGVPVAAEQQYRAAAVSAASAGDLADAAAYSTAAQSLREAAVAARRTFGALGVDWSRGTDGRGLSRP